MELNAQDNPQEWARRVKSLSVFFSEDLLAEIGEAALIKVNDRNEKDANKSACHSHDFTDANMVMHRAFSTLFDVEPGEDDQALIGDAWNEAKEFGFNLF